jgi:hypothetical protein
MKNHNHETKPCEHRDLRYCEICDIAYCIWCKREWGRCEKLHLDSGGLTYYGDLRAVPVNYDITHTSTTKINDKNEME